MSPPLATIQRIAVPFFAALSILLMGCKPQKLEKIKSVKQEKEALDVKEAAAALEVASLVSQLSVLGEDSQAVESALEKLLQRKKMLERETMRLDKLSESISGQTTALENEFKAYKSKPQSKPL